MQLIFIQTLEIVHIRVERVKNRDFKPFNELYLADQGVLYAHFRDDSSLYAILSDLAKPHHLCVRDENSWLIISLHTHLALIAWDS